MTRNSEDQKPEIAAWQWKQIVNGATDTAIITTDLRGRVTSWNIGACNILGWTEEEMIDRSLSRVFAEEDQEAQLSREIADAMTKGKGGGEEGWRRRKDGSRFWAVGELSPIRDKSNVVGFIKILRDRTAQREAEEAIREERHALEVLNRAGSALAAETDLERLVQIVTDAGVALTGAEFGAFFYNVINNAGESYMLYTLSGAPIEAFSKFPMPRNTEVFAPTFLGQGIVRSDDITKDSRYGKNSPRKGMPEGHLPVRSYLAVSVISRTGEVLGGLFFGHARTAVFNERSERGLSGLAAEAAVAIDNVRLSQAMHREIEERKRAQEALVELNATLERQVTERTEQLRKNEEALRQSQKMEAVGQLTGGVAHDFNNLLQIILGNLDTLQRNLPAESGRLQRAARNAMTGAQRAATLTQRLLAFSRRQPLDPKPLDVNALVNGLSDMIHRTLGETIDVETVLGAGVWRVEADPAELEAAVINLAVNARDAMTNGGRLTIETSNAHIDEAYVASHTEVVPGQYVAVAVTDTGVGMDSKTVAQAFEPFFTTKAVGKGTGLGLSQVYGFVKQSGGHVKIYSEVGQGTTVKLYLPRLATQAAGAEQVESNPSPEAAQEETVLVLEDDDEVRAYSVETLRELGYRVIEAHDGPSALRLLERQPRVDLLFTDVVLPGGLTGAQVAAQAKTVRPTLKVLFTTGYARNAIIHHGRLDKGVQLLVKPFSFSDLAAKVRDVLDGASD
ncbi:PAS domain S-box protein [Bradyrhizobium canariense]|uniref:histidine kinase n=1 Tax=Bradyrhizobium canariense TaxID=255045 RepID=A0A1X3G605_9BRAD|nr:PAS domain S-box protein [Bradyrhizobium canariense]OSI78665.1 histidine kinase [Bradyrhizobium canariense]OSI82560.1 histidine kinase [Bradyrhizobium canariense]OSI97795.1 histidine kinase [Bradyrhizobium canariense]OSI99987.1 histidine kinase [Bradyrhizobium canariense]OSJ17098.1 histidine kinase [Bradyrhizobium canariense]